MSVECQVNVKSQSELDIGGRETCYSHGVWMAGAPLGTMAGNLESINGSIMDKEYPMVARL